MKYIEAKTIYTIIFLLKQNNKKKIKTEIFFIRFSGSKKIKNKNKIKEIFNRCNENFGQLRVDRAQWENCSSA